VHFVCFIIGNFVQCLFSELTANMSSPQAGYCSLNFRSLSSLGDGRPELGTATNSLIHKYTQFITTLC
jgi:hypothetical protein